LVYSTVANLLAVPFDLDPLAVTGSLVTVLKQVAMTPGSGMDGPSHGPARSSEDTQKVLVFASHSY
jgi:hypothetical protein